MAPDSPTPPPVSLAHGREVVAIPGPSIIPERVLEAMQRPMVDIYAGAVVDAVHESWALLPGLAGTSGRVFVAISNGHGAWEMALGNTLCRGDRVLVLECGRFAAIWGEMAEFNGLRVEVIEAEPRRAIDPAVVEQRLRDDPSHEIKAVLTVHTDTASSARNDIAAIRRAIDAAGHPALLMVDCIASLSCEEYSMDDWGVDVTVAASQKGLMTPPGLGFVWAGPKALAANATADMRTRYFDWGYRAEDGPIYLRFCGTPPVSHVFALREALAMIDEEGLDNRWRRHQVHADAVRAAVEAWSTPGGIELHVIDAASRSNAVTTIRTGSVDPTALAQRCLDGAGLTLGLGVGAFAGETFRIGHMGHLNPPTVLGVVGTVEAALTSMGVQLAASGVAAAAAVIARAW